MSMLYLAQMNQVLNMLGIANPTVADKTTVMNFLKLLGDDLATNSGNVVVLFNRLGIPNPTTADRTTVMNFLKKIEDTAASYQVSNAWYGDTILGQIGPDNPTVADRTSIMNFLKLIYDSKLERKSAHYASTGTWTCPAGVTTVFVTATAGGGSGTGHNGADTVAGASGGITSFGALLSLTGGSAGLLTGTAPSGGDFGGHGGTANTASYPQIEPIGGVSVFGIPQPLRRGTDITNPLRGNGGNAPSGIGNAIGGGAGAGCLRKPLTVVPGTTYTITIGAGGASTGTGGTRSQAGGAGYMIIEWEE